MTLVALALASCGSDPEAPAPRAETAATEAGSASGPSVDAASSAGLVRAELDRDAASSAIVEVLAHDDAQVRAAGLRALTRIAPPSAATVVVTLLERAPPTPAMIGAVALLDPPPGPRGEAVEPVGPWRELEDHLWMRVAVDEDPQAARPLFLALARIGGRRTQAMLANVVGADEDDAHRSAAFTAMGILCARRQPLVATALPGIAEGLAAAPVVRRAAAFALSRCAPPSAELFAGDERAAWVERLEVAIAGDDQELARLGWKALEALGEAPSELPVGLLGAADDAPPWWVEVEAVRALAGPPHSRARLIERLLVLPQSRWSGARAHVLLVALASLRRGVVEAPEIVAALAPLAERLDTLAPADARSRKIAALARCELRGLAAIASGEIAPVDRCAGVDDGLPRDWAEAFGVDILAAMRSPQHAAVRTDALLQRAADPRPTVAAPALAALADLDDIRVAPALRRALGRDDPGVLAAAAGAVAARAADRGKRDPAAVAGLVALLERTDPIVAIEARLAAIEALGTLARSLDDQGPAIEPSGDALPTVAAPQRAAEARGWLERAVLPFATDPHAAMRRAAWSALASVPELQAAFEAAIPTRFPDTFPEALAAVEAARERPASGLRMHTSTGAIEIEFAGAPAPIAQANLVQLARTGRFDGLRFHRVVPGFVTQGGDPRGDGYGGPGWVMPCEWSDVAYERGTVGIALAGKDTGGSQFFVAHTRQPHLDARFTVIGRVTAGMDAVDALLPHDVIERVEAIE
ncbi:MAG TPA: peptidylprolyl isomerase [Nannocystaceae bacterium]|nr:peptidylprolyl isomerase [Nannocystaceae bacterium]